MLRKEAFEANPDLEHIVFRGTLLSRKYVFDSFEKEVSLEEGFTNYKGNVQIYHGDADEAVHLSYSQKMSVRYENADLHILPGQGHKYEYEVTLKVLQDIANNINN